MGTKGQIRKGGEKDKKSQVLISLLNPNQLLTLLVYLQSINCHLEFC